MGSSCDALHKLAKEPYRSIQMELDEMLILIPGDDPARGSRLTHKMRMNYSVDARRVLDSKHS